MSEWWSFIYSTDEENQADLLSWKKFRRVAVYGWPYRYHIAVAIAGLFVSSWLSLVPGLLTRRLIDYAIPNSSASAITWCAVGMLAARLFHQVVSGVTSQMNSRIAFNLVYQLRYQIFDRLQQMSLAFFINTRKGEIMSRLTEDVANAEGAITTTFITTVGHVVSLVITLIAMIRINFVLTLLALLLFPLFWFPTKRYALVVRQYTQEKSRAHSKLSTFASEGLDANGAMVTKLFGLQDLHLSQFRDRLVALRDASIKYSLTTLGFRILTSMLSASGSALVWFYGGHAVLKGNMTAGTLVEFTAYLALLYSPISSLFSSLSEIVRCTASFDRVFDAMDLPVDIPNPVNPQLDLMALLNSGYCPVALEDVYFSYYPHLAKPDGQTAELGDEVAVNIPLTPKLKTTNRFWGQARTASGDVIGDDQRAGAPMREWALQGVSIRVETGTTCAVVGRSGAGKSSLISLIPRLYDVTRGRLLIAGIDVKDIPFNQLSKVITAVPQDCVLFNDTIAMNLRVAKENATQAELMDACAAAHILDIIMALPNQFDTIVGERGLKLSGGERQRLAIARAILKNPQILLLDEATSHLDSVSEALVQQALMPLMQKHTSIVIAHRLSTILAADVIVCMDEGRVIEVGTHKELLARGGYYATLYNTQFRKQDIEAMSA